MTTIPVEPQDPDLEPDDLPEDDPEILIDPDEFEPEIIPPSESRDDIAAPDPVEDK